MVHHSAQLLALKHKLVVELSLALAVLGRLAAFWMLETTMAWLLAALSCTWCLRLWREEALKRKAP